MNTSDKNKLRFKFEYNGTGDFDVSINKFSINFGEVVTLTDTILPYDPTVIELNEPLEVLPVNGTPIGGNTFSLRFNDDNYYRAQAKTDNLSIQFKFKLLDNTNKRFWDFSLSDWIYNVIYFWKKYPLYPYPTVPLIEFRLAANVSIDDNFNDQLEIAVLDIYNYLEDKWINITEGNKDLAIKDDYQIVQPIPKSITWLFLQLIDRDDDNALKMRLRYVGNESESFENFNVTVDEFTLLFYIQNIYSSDITSKIGFGLDSNRLKPSDIQMKNFGIPLLDDGYSSGKWNNYITDGTPEQGIFIFDVESLWPIISFNVTGICEIYKFEIDIEFEDDFESYYRVGTNYFSVEVTDGFGAAIENLEVTFELIDVDDKVIDEDNAVTNDEGIAKGSLKFKEVGDGYKIKVNYDEEGIYASEDTESDEFRIVDDFTLFMDTFLAWLPYILIGLAAIIAFTAVRHHKLRKLRKFWAKEALILDDLIKISYILIIHKNAGVTIYNKQISMDLDSDLIGGFLTAISQFRSELKKDVIPKPGEKGFEMDYYDFKIVITDGKYTRVALILDGIPSESLKENQWDFTRRFEMKFGANLSEFQGDIRPFRETDDLVDRVFDIKLMYPLQLAKHWEFTKLNKLERALVEVGLEMQKERNFIFASSLLSYGLAGRKASRNQIISTILDLKRRGILIPMEIE